MWESVRLHTSAFSCRIYTRCFNHQTPTTQLKDSPTTTSGSLHLLTPNDSTNWSLWSSLRKHYVMQKQNNLSDLSEVAVTILDRFPNTKRIRPWNLQPTTIRPLRAGPGCKCLSQSHSNPFTGPLCEGRTQPQSVRRLAGPCRAISENGLKTMTSWNSRPPCSKYEHWKPKNTGNYGPPTCYI